MVDSRRAVVCDGASIRRTTAPAIRSLVGAARGCLRVASHRRTPLHATIARTTVCREARITRLYQPAIHVTVETQRGVLATVASEIAEAGSNIDSITMEEDRAVFTTMHFVLEVANRQHLARVMRALRRLPDVQKITRTRE